MFIRILLSIKKILPYSLISFLSSLINISISLITSILYDQAEFSDFFLRMSYSVFLINFIMLGSGSIIAAFRNEILNDEREYLSLWILGFYPLLSLLLFFLYLVFNFLFGTEITYQESLGIILFILGSSGIQLLKVNLLIRKDFKKNIIILTSCLVISLMSILVLNYFESGINNYFFITGFLFYLISLLNIPTRFSIYKFSIKKHLKFGIPTALNSLTIGFLSGGDKILLPLFFYAMTDSSSYLYASMISGYALFIVNVYASYWTSHLSNVWFKLSYEEKLNLFKNNRFLLLWFLLPIVFTPLILSYTMLVDIIDFYTYLVASYLLLFSHVFGGLNKFYLGFLLMLKVSRYNLLTSIYGSAIFIVFVIVTKDYFNLLSLSLSMALSSVFVFYRSFRHSTLKMNYFFT